MVKQAFTRGAIRQSDRSGKNGEAAMEPTYADTLLQRCACSGVECTWIWSCASQNAVVLRLNTLLTLLNREAIVRMMLEDD
jgi:hypothetical protein